MEFATMASSAGSEFQIGSTSAKTGAPCITQYNQDASGQTARESTRVEILAEDFPYIDLDDIPLPPPPFPMPFAYLHIFGNGVQSGNAGYSAPPSFKLPEDKSMRNSSEDQSALQATASSRPPSTNVEEIRLKYKSGKAVHEAQCERAKPFIRVNGHREDASPPSTTSSKGQAAAAQPTSQLPASLENTSSGQQKEEKPYLCTECRQCFPEHDLLEQHLYDHLAEITGKHPFRCPLCPGRRFPDMKQHERHHRMGLECDVCGQAFHAAIVIAEHRVRVHSQKKAHSCKICGESFVTVAELTRHKKYHPKVKPQICKMCGKSFKSKESLSTHMKVHSGRHPSSSKVLKLPKTTKEKASVSRKSVEQKPSSFQEYGVESSGKEKCNVQLKSSHEASDQTSSSPKHHPTQKETVKNHTSECKDERAHKCVQCGCIYSSSEDLASHMKRYHKDDIFVCNSCDKWFSKNEELSSHVDREHKNGHMKDELESSEPEPSAVMSVEESNP